MQISIFFIQNSCDKVTKLTHSSKHRIYTYIYILTREFSPKQFGGSEFRGGGDKVCYKSQLRI